MSDKGFKAVVGGVVAAGVISILLNIAVIAVVIWAIIQVVHAIS